MFTATSSTQKRIVRCSPLHFTGCLQRRSQRNGAYDCCSTLHFTGCLQLNSVIISNCLAVRPCISQDVYSHGPGDVSEWRAVRPCISQDVYSSLRSSTLCCRCSTLHFTGCLQLNIRVFEMYLELFDPAFHRMFTAHLSAPPKVEAVRPCISQDVYSEGILHQEFDTLFDPAFHRMFTAVSTQAARMSSCSTLHFTGCLQLRENTPCSIFAVRPCISQDVYSFVCFSGGTGELFDPAFHRMFTAAPLLECKIKKLFDPAFRRMSTAKSQNLQQPKSCSTLHFAGCLQLSKGSCTKSSSCSTLHFAGCLQLKTNARHGR